MIAGSESNPKVDNEFVVHREVSEEQKSSASSLLPTAPASPVVELKEKPKRRKRRTRSTPGGMAHFEPPEIPLDLKQLGTTAPHLIWVPAHKHPQIAPSEFAAWIKNYTEIESTSGTQPKVQRQKSTLSSTFTFEDTESDSGTGSTISVSRYTSSAADKIHVFDRFSSAEDDSHVLVPHTSRSLSRRSALSARGKSGHNQHRRSFSTIDSPKSQNTAEEPIPIGGIQLYDRPVNMNEWVDLGDAMEDDSAMLARVHDVETQVWTQSPEPPSLRESYSSPPPPSQQQQQATPPPSPPHHEKLEKTQVASLRKSLSVRRKKSTGWLVHLFQDMSRKSMQRQQKESVESETKKQGLGFFFKRSLSLKTSAKKKKRPDSLDNSSGPPVPLVPDIFVGRERLPLHIERAIYHLSHVKLSNPRRPLCQQVVISNFMFWYLSLQQPLAPPVHQPMTMLTPIPQSSPPPPPPPPHRLNPPHIFISPKSTPISNGVRHISPAYAPNAR